MSDTKTYKVLRPIGFNGDRLEKDAMVELTDAEAANIGPDVELVDAHDESEEKSEDSSADQSTSETGSTSAEGEGAGSSSEEAKTDASADGEKESAD